MVIVHFKGLNLNSENFKKKKLFFVKTIEIAILVPMLTRTEHTRSIGVSTMTTSTNQTVMVKPKHPRGVTKLGVDHSSPAKSLEWMLNKLEEI